MDRVVLRVKVSEGAKPPRYATEGASGLDLEANRTKVILPGSWRLIPTGLFFEVPKGFELQIRSRSGLASKGVTVMNQPGTVDSDYRGELLVILHNNTPHPWRVNRGDRIAQAVLSPVARALVVGVQELSETARGMKGLGSTGC